MKLTEKDAIRPLVEKLYPYHYRVNGPGNDEAVPAFLEELPFEIHEFEEEAELNGWIVPRSEVVTKAEIRKDGELIYDAAASPLGTILLCAPFKGTVDLETLKEHLYHHQSDPDAVVFHCVQQYRTGKKDWGICIPRRLFEKLEPGDYDVEIMVEHRPTTMKVLDFHLPGKSEKTVVIQAHNCHPFQANDDISGCAVAIRVLQKLMEMPDRRLSYRLVIAPELTGTLFWLDKLDLAAKNIVSAIIVAACGNEGPLKLQESYTGQAEIDQVAHTVFTERFVDPISGAFRTIYGNDETVFEAPGFEIPTISLSRNPFPTYHSDKDVPEEVSEARLEDTFETLFSICQMMDRNVRYKFIQRGLFCLSHPRYDLYRKVWDPSDRHGPKDRSEGRMWNLLMTNLPRLMDGQTPLLDIAEKYHLKFDEVYEYCSKWVERDLAEIIE